MKYGEICILLLAVIPAMFADTDYCQANLCELGKQHIACDNNGHYASSCRKPRIINITPLYRRQILKKHNSLRNIITKGFKNFPPAKRMATMLWDNELAKLAELNIKQCEVRHDQCRNTPRFPFVGQNLGFARWRKMKFLLYSHFTVMVQDKSNRIGCAILRSVSLGFKQQIMACNYAYDNMLGTPVYRDGQTASQCAIGTDSRFTSLCSIIEQYNFTK